MSLLVDCQMYLLSSWKLMKSNSFYEAVISGDSLILRGRANPQGQPPKERCVRCLPVNVMSSFTNLKQILVCFILPTWQPLVLVHQRERTRCVHRPFNELTWGSLINDSPGLLNPANFFAHSQLARKFLLRRFIPSPPMMISLVILVMPKLRE